MILSRPLASLALLHVLFDQAEHTLPSMAAQAPGIPRGALRDAAVQLTRYGLIEPSGRRSQAYRLRQPVRHVPAASAPTPEQEVQVIRHVGQYRTALALSHALHLPRQEVERVLEHSFQHGVLSRVYVGHLAVYTPSGITSKPELPAP